jgi:Protein of unknown function (DUF2878)
MKGLLHHPIVNGVMFNITWLIIVMSESAVVAPCAALLHLLLHFALMGKGVVELKVIVQVALLGVVVDQLMFYLQVFTVDGRASVPPIWMMCLWPVLATTLMHAFASLRTRFALSAVVGGIGGVASFIAGTRLTDVEFASALLGPVIIAVVWAVLFPLLLQLPEINARKEF